MDGAIPKKAEMKARQKKMFTSISNQKSPKREMGPCVESVDGFGSPRINLVTLVAHSKGTLTNLVIQF
jgi:hypothetical protein